MNIIARDSNFVVHPDALQFYSKAMIKNFIAKVEIGSCQECWDWKAFINPSGYGMFRVGKITVVSNRVSWELHAGQQIPKGMEVCHACDRPRCVNYHHLWVGTHGDNIRDMVQKRRHWMQVDPQRVNRGEASTKAKLKEPDVLEIFQLIDAGISHAEIASRFQVNRVTITNISTGATWKHLKPDWFEYRKGLAVGSSSVKSKLTDADVMAIRELSAEGFSALKLADQFNISNAQIYRIIKRERWKHL